MLTALALSLLGCSSGERETPATCDPIQTVGSVVEAYGDFHQMTAAPVLVDPIIAALCVSPQPSQLEVTRQAYGPHANAAIVVYMNDLAAQAFNGGRNRYPEGAVIVKEKQPFASSTGSSNEGVGGMIKRAPGFDPAYGDWEYFYRDSSAPLQSGAIASCSNCHRRAADTDYVFGDWASEE
ncbi:cytochrome P460 family protein [Botrimarina colliarenosi]|uniref:cytochrome P460 family protein n=1 Tax=Botrimarina colliarenosi TaxID=2528001 RepID=UPI0018D324CC|nr:cytochrome P460 family protein [Botrimarina colliarenosi]